MSSQTLRKQPIFPHHITGAQRKDAYVHCLLDNFRKTVPSDSAYSPILSLHPFFCEMHYKPLPQSLSEEKSLMKIRAWRTGSHLSCAPKHLNKNPPHISELLLQAMTYPALIG